MVQGKMIAVYGINGIGKTTQVERLVEFLHAQGKEASRVKYPVYDLEPEGPFIYKYLREPAFRAAHPQSTEELQQQYAENRRRYQSELERRLATGEWIIAEDYTGTGIAWGLTWGADLKYLEAINSDLRMPDLSILMHGHRFDTAIEKDHRNEMDSERIRICKNFHELLSDRYAWQQVNANQSIEAVSKDIQGIINEFLKEAE